MKALVSPTALFTVVLLHSPYAGAAVAILTALFLSRNVCKVYL